MSKIVGIDLGTTNSLVATVDSGIPFVIADAEGRRLTPSVRHRATYDRSLAVLARVKARCGSSIHTKSGIMLGLGETETEVWQAMEDLRVAKCDILTLGQYLQPTLKHLPVVEFIPPVKFAEYKTRADAMGFVHVASGPMVRSSYHAREMAEA